MPSTRSLRSRAALASLSNSNSSNVMPNLQQTASPSVTVLRSSSSSTPPEERRKSIRLTVKMPSSKLREVTNGAPDEGAHRPHNIFTEDLIVTGPRNSRTKRKLVEVETDDEEDLISDEEEEEEDDDDADNDDDEEEEEDEDEGEDEGGEEDAEADSELDAEGEPDIDAEGDVDMDDAPPVTPVAKQATARPVVTVTPAIAAKVRNVESKHVADDDDEDLSEPDSGSGGRAGTSAADEMNEEEEEEDEEEEEEEEEESDSDLGTPMDGSRASTPDLSKMTKRQRGRIELGGDFLQLPMEPQVKKHLTAEEHAMRRAEMARRRKNLSEKRNEEEKMDTINKLLKKQAPKRRGKISAAEISGDNTAAAQEFREPEKADPVMIRYVMNRDGCRVGVPEEWLGTPAGALFENPANGVAGRKLVEEI
ncbi:hypothetical protein FQN57_002091 [Myotisia sp. PD_48]|nr:hypothetical protein FQN57_002091 [Myotisia sp. PD_48]